MLDFITNWDKLYYTVGAILMMYYKLGQVLLQTGTAFLYYKVMQVVLQSKTCIKKVE